MAHDMVGPISSPSVGPVLPRQLSMIVTELVWSMPDAIITKAHTIASMK